jgi:hypothetical protein
MQEFGYFRRCLVHVTSPAYCELLFYAHFGRYPYAHFGC